MSAEVLPVGSKLDEILNSGINHDVDSAPMKVWDKGVFLNELQRQGIVLSTENPDGGLVADRGLRKGTYKGTQLALTEMYSIVEESAVSHFNSQGYEPIFPTQRTLEQKQTIYQWSDAESDKFGYPPHLKSLPADELPGPEGQERKDGVGQIFNKEKQGFVQLIAQAVGFLIPDTINHEDTPYAGPTLADCEKWNKDHQSEATDIMKGRNIGEHADWYSDARFAQQHLSGVNPSTIEAAASEKVEEYVVEAGKQGLEDMKKLLEEGQDILIQDYSYFREATGIKDEDSFKNTVPELKPDQKTPTGNFTFRYACAPVVIFQLNSDGRLHPLAITLDYKGSLNKSITIFNRRLTPDDKGDVDEKDD
ncbi:hypothetical protein ACJ41O_011903 [Fusarium nematophilum]